VTTHSLSQSKCPPKRLTFLIRLQQFTQGFDVKLVITKIQRGIDGFEWLEVDIDLPFFPFGRDNFPTVNDEAIGRDFVV